MERIYPKGISNMMVGKVQDAFIDQHEYDALT